MTRPLDSDFETHRCECGRTRAEHRRDPVSDDHTFEPAIVIEVLAYSPPRGTKGRI